jgi:hypothetical protein
MIGTRGHSDYHWFAAVGADDIGFGCRCNITSFEIAEAVLLTVFSGASFSMTDLAAATYGFNVITAPGLLLLAQFSEAS